MNMSTTMGLRQVGRRARGWMGPVVLLLVGLWSTPGRGEQALQFTLQDLEGDTFSLEEQLAQGPVVLDFWATWCKPCLKSLPKMQELAKAYEKRGVKVYTVNIDGPSNQAKIRPFLRRFKLQLPVLLDPSNSLMKQFHLTAPPAALIIEPGGRLAYKHQGYRAGDEDKWREIVEGLAQREDSREESP